MVDIEADGPIPGDYSMVCLGAVVVDEKLDKTFYADFAPVSEKWIPEALAVSGFTREKHLLFGAPGVMMSAFKNWINKVVTDGRPMFIADNNGFDWQFVNWYFHHYLGSNPFGFSSTNLGSLYKGIVLNMRQNFKHLRKTKHTHNPVDDAMGNAEAMLHMINKMSLKI